MIEKRRLPVAISAILIAGHALLLAYSAGANSATFDEPAHLAAGVEYWKRGDWSIYSLSPPLLRLWAGLPAVLAKASAPPTTRESLQPIVGRHWSYADDFVSANFSRFAFLLLLARLGMIPISCFAAWVIFRWAGELYGPVSGAAACAMYCLNPSILANGALVTTDIGTTAAMAATAWLWWRFCRRPSWRGWALVVVAALAAHLCKFTAALLWPVMLAMVIPFALAAAGRARWRLPGAWIGAAAAVLLLLNVLYGFHGSGQTFGSFDFSSNFMRHLQQMLPARFPSPLPRIILLGFDAQKLDTEGGYPAFLFGEIYIGSRWYYYPQALLCKLPVAMLLLAAAALASAPTRRRAVADSATGEWSALLGGAVFVLGVLCLGDLNIGTRYLLPAFPFAFVLISRLWSMDRSPTKRSRSLLPYLRNGLLAMLTVETLLVCPRFLTFVNFVVGGPANGWRLLSDSDFDWGQGLIDLRNWMRVHHTDNVALAYFGYVDPAVYGIQFKPIIHPGDDQVVAVSSYFLDGLQNRMVTGAHQRAIVGLPYYKALQEKPPIATAGHTIFIYSREEIESAAEESAIRGPGGP